MAGKKALAAPTEPAKSLKIQKVQPEDSEDLDSSFSSVRQITKPTGFNTRIARIQPDHYTLQVMQPTKTPGKKDVIANPPKTLTKGPKIEKVTKLASKHSVT